MAEHFSPTQSSGGDGVFKLGRWAHIAGATISFALIAGGLYWSYKIVSRDVNQIPVVMARSEPMRVAPENPGGEVAVNLDLAVTNVASDDAPELGDEIILAPDTVALSEEDLPPADIQQLKQIDSEPNVAADGAAETLDMAELADSLAQGVEPLSDATPEPEGTNIVQGNIEDALRIALGDADTAQPVSYQAPTEPSTIRPKARPAELSSDAMSPTLEQSAPIVEQANISVGSALVQFGAYDTAEVAQSEWDRLQQQLGAVMADRPRLIEKAQSGGRIFYRLRTAGFADLADARRFCSAVSVKSPCIPVLAR